MVYFEGIACFKLSPTATGKPYAGIFRRPDHCPDAWNGGGPRPAPEKARDKGHEIRRRRQKGFSDSAFRPFLFLHGICFGIRLPCAKQRGDISFRNSVVG